MAKKAPLPKSVKNKLIALKNSYTNLTSAVAEYVGPIGTQIKGALYDLDEKIKDIDTLLSGEDEGGE